MVGAIVVLAFGLIVRELPQFTGAEYRIDRILGQHRTGFLDWLAFGLNDIFGIAFGPWLAAGGGLFLVVRQKGLSALALVASIAAGCASCWLMKLLVSRHSPTTEPVWISYPSGHVAFAASLGVAAYWIFNETRWRRHVLLGSVLMVAIVAWSRLYLAVHYPTDVLASCLLTLAAAGFAAGAWNRYLPKLLRVARQLRQDA
ncbi:phosphatase PAP2 family protein [Arthrobacter sp. efr-133-R2A-120]|uniref:phosphatase PAP2 family protein n=1 Tax=Arthrobacter sp. efr-133-R2A-120 TaxID=3040277 RepID=UPI00254BFEE1|nr:phosphatase PAP2 family protein [Arthrobacter sp. efr-133-R2A-120]